MADYMLPLMVNDRPLDTATPIRQANEDQQNNALRAEQTLRMHYDNMDARDKSRLASVVIGAAQLKPFLDRGDYEGATNLMTTRQRNIHRRMAEGEPIDSQETDAALDMAHNKRWDELKSNVDGVLAAGQVYGLINVQNTAGGDTGILADRLVKEGSAKDINEALQIIKGGAGQTGKNTADISSGSAANYATQSGQNRSDVETASQKAFNTETGKAAGERQAEGTKTIQGMEGIMGAFNDLKASSVNAPSGTFEDIGATLANKGGAGGPGARAQADFIKKRAAAENAIRASFRVVGSGGQSDADAKPFIDMLPDSSDSADVKASAIDATMQALRTKVSILARQRGLQDPFESGGQPNAMPAGSGGKIRVSNGQEIFEIDASDLQAAMQEGFQQVQ